MTSPSPARRLRVTVVSDVPASLDGTNGFGGRLVGLLIGLADVHDVSLVTVAGNPDPLGLSATSAVRPWRSLPGPGPVDLRPLLTKVRRLLSPSTPYMCQVPAGPLAEVIAQTRPDVVVVHLPYLAHVLRRLPHGVPVVALLEEGWERLSPPTHGPVRRLLRHWDARRTASLYRQVAERAFLATAISEQEQAWFARYGLRTRVLPHAVDPEHFAPLPAPAPDIDVAVFGDLSRDRNWLPARDVVLVARRRTDWRWGFVGRSGPGIEQLAGPGDVVTGLVPDVRPFYPRAKAVLVPADAGTGVKTTVLQAWAAGRPVVVSRHATIGLAVEPGVNALVADSPDHAVVLLERVLTDTGLADALGRAGRATVL
ncbi:MAG: glycosyltransferase family 4 protein, partial [Actinomycetota bacterium]|nr:glycosyltransferase family 4 protein [Actinomycetota bacterium]